MELLKESSFGISQRKTQEGILTSFKPLHQNSMRFTTEVSKWLLKMLTKIKKLYNDLFYNDSYTGEILEGVFAKD